ncbi:nitroreductase family deazaflavin-dependent oxidoreductase [Mycobacterium sp. pW045]|uniref:nitroreductase family deazaflavin-dependent oxidoreductase n=1 Tax=Mycobacterium sp. pW045 TaxID=3238984 RepID=UPI00351BD806
MRVGRSVARFNRRFTNRAALRVVGRMPALGILEHTGHRTGNRYRTPLLVFDTADGYALLIGYGPTTHWVRNVLVHGSAAIRKHGRTHRVAKPRILSKAQAAHTVKPLSRPLYLLFPYNEAVLVLTKCQPR